MRHRNEERERDGEREAQTSGKHGEMAEQKSVVCAEITKMYMLLQHQT